MQIAIVSSTELAESMVASDHIRTVVPPEALTEREQDTLLVLAASVEKVAKVKAGRGLRENRAWSRGGNID